MEVEETPESDFTDEEVNNQDICYDSDLEKLLNGLIGTKDSDYLDGNINMDRKTLESITEMFNEDTVGQISSHKSGIVSQCLGIIAGKTTVSPDLFIQCVKFLEAGILVSTDICRDIIESDCMLELCHLFDHANLGGKKLVLSVFTNFIHQFGMVDREISNCNMDETIERIMFQACSAVNTQYEPLLLQSLTLISNMLVVYWNEYFLPPLILKSDLIPRLAAKANHPNNKIRTEAVESLQNLVSLNCEIVTLDTNKSGMMNQLPLLLLSENTDLHKMAMYTLADASLYPKDSSDYFAQYILTYTKAYLASRPVSFTYAALRMLANILTNTSPKQKVVFIKDKELLALFVDILQVVSQSKPEEIGERRYSNILLLLVNIFDCFAKCLLKHTVDPGILPPRYDTDVNEVDIDYASDVNSYLSKAD